NEPQKALPIIRKEVNGLEIFYDTAVMSDLFLTDKVSLNQQHSHCQNPKSVKEFHTILTDHTYGLQPYKAPVAPSPVPYNRNGMPKEIVTTLRFDSPVAAFDFHSIRDDVIAANGVELKELTEIEAYVGHVSDLAFLTMDSILLIVTCRNEHIVKGHHKAVCSISLCQRAQVIYAIDEIRMIVVAWELSNPVKMFTYDPWGCM
nr:hypothetical protein [Tanacetum cinerariifolium]